MTVVIEFDPAPQGGAAGSLDGDQPVFEVIGTALLPELEAAGGFNEAQVRVRKGNREGGRWLDTAGGLARGLQEGTLWSQPGDDTGVYAIPTHNAREMPPEAAKLMLDAGMPVPDQSKVINYTGGAYALANDTLRGKSGRNENLSGMVDDPGLPRDQWTKRGQRADQIIADLDSQMTPLSNDVVLYRNLNKHDAFGTEDPGELVGQVLRDKGYMSTSYDQTRYPPLNEVGHPAARLRIRAPKGTRSIYAAPVSAFEQEAELILDRGTRLAIIGYDPYTGFVDAVVVGDPITTATSPELVAAAMQHSTYGGDAVTQPVNDLTAAGGLGRAGGSFNPAQARVAKGNRHGGRWLQTAGPVADGLDAALNRSMNRLTKGSDIGELDLPGTAEEIRAARRQRADEVLAEEGRPSLQETADRISGIYARTTPKQREAGKVWYDEAQDLAVEMVNDPNTDLTLEQSAAIIAHLSTRTRWEANADYARSLAAGLTQDEALAHLKAEVLAGRIAKPRQGGDGIMDRNWEKALSAAASDDPIGRGNLGLGTFSEKNKTRTFADNILGDSDGVTVDAWMERVIGQGLDPIGNIFPPGKKTGDIRGNKDLRGDRVYEAMSEAVRVAADEAGISPTEMQAVVWGWALENYVASREGHPGRFVDGDLVLPVTIGGEQELIDSGDLIAAGAPVEFDDTEGVPDYWYAMAEKLLGIIAPVEEVLPPKAEPERREAAQPEAVSDLTAAGGFNEGQRRVAKGNPSGGQWVDDAGTIANGLEGIIGPEGTPMSYAELKALGGGELAKRVNPGLFDDPPSEYTARMYREDKFTRLEYVVNCQRTSAAVEMQARGFNVVANGAPKLGAGKDWAEDGTHEDIALNWRQTRDALPEGIAGQVAFGYGHPPREAREQMLANNPVGARFILTGTWGGSAGHAWNAEIVDSPFGPQLVEIDAQMPMNLERAGGSYTLNYGEDAFSDISFLRVDDKLPSDQLWTGGPTTGASWIQTPEDFAAENAAVRADPQQPWEYAAAVGGPITFEMAQQVVREASGHPTVPFGWDAETAWVVLAQTDPTIYNNVAWYVDKLTGEPAEHSLHPGHGYPRVETGLTAAGGFNEAQRRVQKGNREGGQWLDTAGRIAGALEGASDGIPGHSMPLVEFNSDEFRGRAEGYSARTNGAMNQPPGYGSNGESFWGENAYAMTGFDKNKATIVDVLPEGSLPIYRGVGANREQSEQFIDQFKNGDHFPGRGIFGAGSYFAQNREEAGEYAGWLREQDGGPWSDHTDLIVGAIKPGARILHIDNDKHGDYDEGGHSYYLNQIRAATGGKEYIPGAGVIGGMNISRDIGAAAALAGYDVIQVTGLRDAESDYYVVLNRGAMFVTEENEAE